MDNIVGLGDAFISSSPDDKIKTFALASCVGITAFCSSAHVAGMIHIVLPFRPKNIESSQNPCYYASTGVPLFINSLLEKGCKKSELTVNIYGGANSINFSDCFNIGLRNLHAVQDSLKALGIRYNLADVGGCISRTLMMDVGTGSVKVNTLPIII
jgi:chemotaxis protein CheD